MRRTVLWTGGARVFTVGVAVILALMLWIAATALPATMLSGTTLAQASNTVTLDPTSGPSGTKVNAIGKGWPHGVVNVAWDGTWLPEETQADAAGNFTLPFTVPQNATPGSHTVSFDGQQGSWADVRFTVTETSGKDNTKPGGRWVSPAKNFVVTGKNTVHFEARAYDSGGSGVKYVNFTAWWPGINPKVWHEAEACTKFRPTSGNVYECDWNPSGVPNGPLMVSFDVYDKADNKNLAPNGLRKGKVERKYAFKFP